MIINIVRQKKRVMLTLAALYMCGKVYGAAPSVQVVPFPKGIDAPNIYPALRSINIKVLDEFKSGEDAKEVLLLKRLLKIMLVLPIEKLPSDIKNDDLVKGNRNQLFMPQAPDKKCINAWALLSTLPDKYPETPKEQWKNMIKDLNKVLIDSLLYIKKEGIIDFNLAEFSSLLGTYSTFITKKNKNIKDLKALRDSSKWSSSLDQATSAYNEIVLKNSINTFADMVPLTLSHPPSNDSNSYQTYHFFVTFIVAFIIGIIGGVLSIDHDEELQDKKNKKKKDAEDEVDEQEKEQEPEPEQEPEQEQE